MNHPNNITELMEQAGEALNRRDTENLEDLKLFAENWLQTMEEGDAMRTMLDSMIEAAIELYELDL